MLAFGASDGGSNPLGATRPNLEREMKKRYEHIDHPSDVGFEAYGDTLEELFENAAIATYSFMTNIEDMMDEEATERREFDIRSEDLKSLMFDWLDEILFFFESDMLIFIRFNIKIDEKEFSLKGFCDGIIFDPSDHEAYIIVKAVTYHMMDLKKNDRWTGRVVLDV